MVVVVVVVAGEMDGGDGVGIRSMIRTRRQQPQSVIPAIAVGSLCR